jgi:hypothetical protein
LHHSFGIADVVIEVLSSCLRGVCTPDATPSGHSCACDSTGWSGDRCDIPAPNGCGMTLSQSGRNSIAGWSSNVGSDLVTTMCRELYMIGGFGVLGAGAWLERRFDFTDSPHMAATVSLTFIKIDAWDEEKAMVLVDGLQVWARSFGYDESHQSGMHRCGNADPGDEDEHWWEISHSVGPLHVVHYQDVLTLRVTTTLDEGPTEESFGIADVVVSTEPDCGRGTCVEGTDLSSSCECPSGWAGDACTTAVLGECGGFIQDAFASGTDGWSSSLGAELRTMSCGSLGQVLGGFGRLGAGAWLSKNYDLSNQQHNRVELEFTFIKIDSWDEEEAMAFVDGEQVWSQVFPNDGMQAEQQQQHCGQDWAEESEYRVGPLRVAHTADSLTLRMTTTLDEEAENESWGIADVIIEVVCSSWGGGR